MAGTIFKQEVMKATERSWEEWIVALGQEVGPLWSHEQIRNHIVERIRYPGNGASGSPSCMSRSWGGCPSAYPKMPGWGRRWPRQKRGFGISSCLPRDCHYGSGMFLLWSRRSGMSMNRRKACPAKLRWSYPTIALDLKRKEWDNPSRSQIYVLSTKTGKTTIAIHQEMLDDVYMREIMRRYWDEMLTTPQNRVMVPN